MVNTFRINDEKLKKMLKRAFQSGHINFLLGSGASLPAISLAGGIEEKVNKLRKEGNEEEADTKMLRFLENIQRENDSIICGGKSPKKVKETLKNYDDMIEIIETILVNRESSLLPKKANIFTTNYDLFIEKSTEEYPLLRLNDGFNSFKDVKQKIVFSPNSFFDVVYNTSNAYHYKVEIPTINLIKLHGSLSWTRGGDEIIYSLAKKEKLEDLVVIFPEKDKLKHTTIDYAYYNLLRIYANELDKENVLLIVFGFSFADEHILDITKKALKNPTLKLIVFSYNAKDVKKFKDIFLKYHNVNIVEPATSKMKITESKIKFDDFNSVMRVLDDADNDD